MSRGRRAGHGKHLSETQEVQDLLLAHFQKLLPKEALPYMQGTLLPTRVGFRIHYLQASNHEVLERLKESGVDPEPIPFRRGMFSVPLAQRTRLTHSSLCEEGKIYIMNPSSTLAVEALEPQPNEEILDLAAAPGGKSLLIADRMQNRGRLACVEPVKGRFFRLKDNLARGGVVHSQLYLADGCLVGRKVPQRFDRVLLDAPCSSEARVRLNQPETWTHWSPRKVKETSRKQRKLLLSALESVKIGGRVVYSTCSLSPEENEGVISSVLQTFDGKLELLPHGIQGVSACRGLIEWPSLKLDPRCHLALRIVPDGLYDAFFLCVLKRLA